MAKRKEIEANLQQVKNYHAHWTRKIEELEKQLESTLPDTLSVGQTFKFAGDTDVYVLVAIGPEFWGLTNITNKFVGCYCQRCGPIHKWNDVRQALTDSKAIYTGKFGGCCL